MLQSQVAGRHGSYATQFWRSSVAPHYRNRAAMRAAYSRKAINRRLVLPLDSHNWMRSLEVLNAGYARLGRTPEHYQAVLRDMVEHHGSYAELADNGTASPPPSPSPSSAADILPAIDSLRDKAYAGEIPSNGSLWVTLVWSYCTLEQPEMALETFHQARRRFRFSVLTLQHMAELLLPVLCRCGQLDEATALYEAYLKPDALDGQNHGDSPGTSARRGNIDDAEARRWLAEAAALQGDWKKTQQFTAAPANVRHGVVWTDEVGEENGKRGGTKSRSSPVATSHRPPFITTTTINSLFQSPDSAPLRTATTATAASAPSFEAASSADPLSSQQRAKRSDAPRSSTTASLPLLSTLSPAAVRRLFHSLCRESTDFSRSATSAISATGVAAAGTAGVGGGEPQRHLTDALACWERLYGPLPRASTSNTGHRSAAENQPARHTPPIEDVHELLNLYAAHGRWEAMLDFFGVAFLHRPSSVYLAATPAELRSLSTSGAEAAFNDETFADASLFPYEAELPLDPVTLNLVFASFPRAADTLHLRIRGTDGVGPSGTLVLPAAARPVTVVRLLDDLLTYRDDMVLTDVVMAAVGPALLQVGQEERVFELLARTPMMTRALERKAALQLSAHAQELKTALTALGYAAYALRRGDAARRDMVRRMPHLFPPEVVRRLAKEPLMGDAASSPLAVLEGPVVAVPENSVLSSSLPMGEEEVRPPTESPSPMKGNGVVDAGVTPSLLDRRWRLYTDHTHPSQLDRDGGDSLGTTARVSRRGRSSATLTALADDAMRRDYLRLQETRHAAFTGSYADADRDPRPIPKGLHDHASGWDFFGRGGEKVFANHKRTPHPFSMRPKVMRDLRDPYRGWNPRRNSSLAHKENVIKWNGKSAV